MFRDRLSWVSSKGVRSGGSGYKGCRTEEKQVVRDRLRGDSEKWRKGVNKEEYVRESKYLVSV